MPRLSYTCVSGVYNSTKEIAGAQSSGLSSGRGALFDQVMAMYEKEKASDKEEKVALKTTLDAIPAAVASAVVQGLSPFLEQLTSALRGVEKRKKKKKKSKRSSSDSESTSD